MYVYQLMSEKNNSYIGQRSKNFEGDSYMGSSSYFNRDFKDEKRIKILLKEVDTKEQLDLWESFLICADRMLFHRKSNVNRNYGAYLRHEIGGWNKGIFGKQFHSEKTKKRIGDSSRGKTLEERFGKEKSDLIKEKISKGRSGFKHTEKSKELIKEKNIIRFLKKEEHKKLSDAHKKLKHWTNGIIDTQSEICPDGFWNGRSKMKGKIPHNKGKKSGKRWFTNGTDSILSVECPYGYKLGRIIKKEKSK